MKSSAPVIILLLLVFGVSAQAQQPQQINLKNFPSDQPINYVEGWGDMTVAMNHMPAGTDLSPLLDGLKNNSCQVPHWGLIKEGVISLTYDDGTVQRLESGDLFYMPPGHKAVIEEDLTIIDFSPAKGFGKLMKHFDEKMQEANK